MDGWRRSGSWSLLTLPFWHLKGKVYLNLVAVSLWASPELSEMRWNKDKHSTLLQLLLGPNMPTFKQWHEAIQLSALCRCSCDGCYMQAEAGFPFIPISSEAGTGDGSRQHSLHLCQALSVPSLPGQHPALLLLNYIIREELMMGKGWQGLARNVAGGLCSQVKCHRRVSVNREVLPLWGNVGWQRMGCLCCCAAVVFCQSPLYSFHKSCCIEWVQGGNLLGKW